MEGKINTELAKALFFRKDMASLVKDFITPSFSKFSLPTSLLDQDFLTFIKNARKGSYDDRTDTKYLTRLQKEITRCIEDDNLELLQEKWNKQAEIRETKTEINFFETSNLETPLLHFSIIKGAMKCFKFILLSGADPSISLDPNHENCNPYDWNCMALAACFGRWEIMKILEDKGMNKFLNGGVWEAAALTHRNTLLKQLLEHCQNNLIEGEAICFQKGVEAAVKGNNLKGLKILLSKKIPNYSELLHVATKFDNTQMIRIFLSKGADVSSKDQDGYTPLHHAANNDKPKTAALLISKGAFVDIQDNDGYTPLHFAAHNGFVAVMKLLLSKGADPNAKSSEGEVPLHKAAQNNEIEAARVLVAHGADVNAKNEFGETPIQNAFDRAIKEFFILKGAVSGEIIEEEDDDEESA